MNRRGLVAQRALFAAAGVVLAGCATFSTDGGVGRVNELTHERTGHAARWQRTAADREWSQARITELLAKPLTADAAVEVALLNNPGLQSSFQALGIAEADLVQAGRLRNPVFGFGKMRAGGITTEIERAVIVNVLALLTMPLSRDLEQDRFGQTQFQVAADAVDVAAQSRRAYFSAVAAQELTRHFERVKDAADASSELARRMVQAGNLSRLAQMREHAFYADATARLARARQQATAERERLTRALGLQSSREFTLSERLPELPPAPEQPQDAEQVAMDKRLDVLMAKQSADTIARALELTRVTRMVNVLDVAYRNKSVTDEPRENGYEIEIELPIFDFGTTRVARAEATYMQSVQRASEVAVNARSQVRESYTAYRTTYDLARHYRDEVVPLRKRISEEALLRYNGMLIGIFELLADTRDQVASVTAAIEAQRDFWLADTDLQMAMTGTGSAPGRVQRMTTSAVITPDGH
jgi:outer membrane protein TolC